MRSVMQDTGFALALLPFEFSQIIRAESASLTSVRA